MKHGFVWLLAAASVAPATALDGAPAPRYTARRDVVDGVTVVRLVDAVDRVAVSLAPALGNLVYEIKAENQNLVWFPYPDLAAFRARPALCGIPFLAPWANRLDHDGFWANGRHYLLNGGLGNLLRDANGRPLHGLLTASPEWQVTALRADGDGALVTSRLEYWRNPELMAQFPFAHTIEVTHRLCRGELEIETTIINHAVAPMPVAVGYHPYLRIPGVPRAAWRARLPVREEYVLSDDLLPTGQRRPVAPMELAPFPGTPRGRAYTHLLADRRGEAEFVLEGEGKRVSVRFGRGYRVALVYAPPDAEYVCFEPMAAPGNGFNLAHQGRIDELESVPAGGCWRESFSIRASGFANRP